MNKNEALTYMNLDRDWRPVSETHPSILFGAGAIVSTTNDLAKFSQVCLIPPEEKLAVAYTFRD